MSTRQKSHGAARWRFASVGAALTGYLLAVYAAMAIMSIDHVDTADHFTAGQDAIAITGATVGIAIFVCGCWLTGRLWKRPHERPVPRGHRWARELPGTPIARNEVSVVPFGVWWRKNGLSYQVVATVVSAGLLVLWGGKGTDVGAAVLVSILVAAASVLAAAAIWSHDTRAIAVGDGWLAWRSRALRSWRLLYIEDLIEDRRYHHDQRLLLTRADGIQLRLDALELKGDVGTAIQLQAASRDAPLAPPPDGATEQWLPDPSGRHPDRWWDGTQWTHWVRDKPGGTRSEDPARP